MSASTRSMDRSGRIWLLGLFLCFLFFMAWWLGDPYAAGAALVLGLTATGLAARTPAGLAAFKAALEDMGKRRRDLALKDACRTWDRWGDLAGLAGELFAYNIERREYYRGAVVGIGNPFFLCNAKGSITHASQTLFALLKKPEKEVVNVTVGQAFEDHEGGFFAAEVMARGTATREERELHLWDGRTLPVFLYADCIRDGKNQVIGCVASIVDLSVLKEQQRQLQAHEEQMVRLGQEINGLAQRAASAAEELSASADEQARGAETQKRQTESVATAMEEMRASVLEVARNAGKTSEAAGEANESANAGGGLVGRAVEGIHEVSASAGRLSGVLSQLEEQTGEIGRIIGVINEIADQTNLLALNAAIEAARAGDAGRGFAVVADEVRKLAEKTMTATREVAEAIKKVQTGSNQAQASMQETERRVENSTRLSSEAGTAIRGVTGRIEDMTVRVAQIATAAEEQSVAAEEINRSIEDIARVAGDAEEAADQTAAATRELADLSQQLLTLSRTFQNGG